MQEEQLNKLIASRITMYLSEQEKTQNDLAQYMHVSQATVSNWCKGIKMPRMDKIDRICAFFGCRRSDLMNTTHMHDGSALTLTKEETELVLGFRAASDDAREMMLSGARRALNASGAKSSSSPQEEIA